MTPERLAVLRAEFEAAVAGLPEPLRPNLDRNESGEYARTWARVAWQWWLLAHGDDARGGAP